MYNAHFNFCESPFAATPDPQFYYSNAAYQEAWATLRYGVEARKGFIVIVGEPGTGKTTLIRKACCTFAINVKTAYLPMSWGTSMDLVPAILTDLGLTHIPANRFEMLAQLSSYLVEEHEHGRTVVVLVDEAQNLDCNQLEELRELGNFETTKDKLLQVILLGQLELEEKLEYPRLWQLKQRIALRARLRPLETHEVRSYIDVRLRAAGRADGALFDDHAIEKIACYSHGVPRLINIICDNALLTAYGLSAQQVTGSMIEEVAADLRLRASSAEEEIPATPAPRDIEAPSESKRAAVVDHAPTRIANIDLAVARASQRSRASRLVARFAHILLLLLSVLLLQSSQSHLPANQLTLLAAAVDHYGEAASETEERWETQEALVQHAQLFGPHEPLSGTESKVEALELSRENLEPTTTNGSGEDARAPALESSGHTADKRSEEIGKRENRAKNALRVTEVSFVRAIPRSDAAIVAVLEPGARIQIAGQTGEYYRVQGLEPATIAGYVHKEDAFFEPQS